MLITRKQYDQLIEKFPAWMKDSYLKLNRQWTYEGVYIHGEIGLVNELTKMLSILQS